MVVKEVAGRRLVRDPIYGERSALPLAGPLGLPERYALVTCLLPVYRWYHTVGVVTDRVSLASPPYPSRVFRVECLHSRYSTKIWTELNSFADE